MRTSNAWLTVFTLAALVGLPACDGGGEPAEEEPAAEQPAAEAPAQDGMPQLPADAPEGVTQEMVAQGQQVFTGQGNCYTCHGMDGTGTQLAPDLTDGEWINIDGSYESIADNIRTGVPQPEEFPSPMPPMGGGQLSDEQVEATAAYVYALSQGG